MITDQQKFNEYEYLHPEGMDLVNSIRQVKRGSRFKFNVYQGLFRLFP